MHGKITCFHLFFSFSFFFFWRGFKHFMSNKQRPLPLRYCTFDFADQSYANKSALILFWMDSHTLDSPTSQLAWNQQVATESAEPLEYLNTQHYFIQFISCPHIAHSQVGCKIALSKDNFAFKKIKNEITNKQNKIKSKYNADNHWNLRERINK